MDGMSSSKKISPWFLLAQDLAFVGISIVVAVALVKSDALVGVLTSSRELEYLGSFLAGLFFTSIFTTAPAIVTLGELAQANGIVATAAFGAFGALAGDLIIFRFIRDGLSEHLAILIATRGRKRTAKRVFTLRIFRWLTFLVGGLIIASPLPDELGVGMLGLSKMRLAVFIPLSLLFNFIGILGIGLVATAL